MAWGHHKIQKVSPLFPKLQKRKIWLYGKNYQATKHYFPEWQWHTKFVPQNLIQNAQQASHLTPISKKNGILATADLGIIHMMLMLDICRMQKKATTLFSEGLGVPLKGQCVKLWGWSQGATETPGVWRIKECRSLKESCKEEQRWFKRSRRSYNHQKCQRLNHSSLLKLTVCQFASDVGHLLQSLMFALLDFGLDFIIIFLHPSVWNFWNLNFILYHCMVEVFNYSFVQGLAAKSLTYISEESWSFGLFKNSTLATLTDGLKFLLHKGMCMSLFVCVCVGGVETGIKLEYLNYLPGPCMSLWRVSCYGDVIWGW